MTTKTELIESLKTAHSRGERPSVRRGANLRGADLCGANLRDADLRDANLRDADLRGANLRGADLCGANLRDADLRDADLWGADLRDADLRDADLRGANLRDADLWGANLWGADLRDANLRDADLRGANLRGADLRGANLPSFSGAVRALGETPSGLAQIQATPLGWMMRVGCWNGTPVELRTLIAKDEGWPEAVGDQVAERRPFLENALALADLHIAKHPTYIAELAEKWGDK